MPLNDKSPGYWLENSMLDEQSAEILRRENGPASISAYHYHQAAEKLIKGAILASGAMFFFIHDLGRLYVILYDSRPDLPDIRASVEKLQSY
jgi:HEPN domain-containing protein